MKPSIINGVVVESRVVLRFVFCSILAKNISCLQNTMTGKFKKIDISGLENGYCKRQC